MVASQWRETDKSQIFVEVRIKKAWWLIGYKGWKKYKNQDVPKK